MSTTFVTIDTDWTEIHATAEEIDVSCNNKAWFAVLATSTPASTVVGRKLEANKVYNFDIQGSDKLYGRVRFDSAIIAKDV